jgi:nicotinamide-nucleotide amidase
LFELQISDLILQTYIKIIPKMQAEIITIGDELLIGQTIDTNSAWLGQQLSLRGISIYRCTSISDKKEEIIDVIDKALNRSELVLVTGGLGPTKDDITKHTLCEYFKTKLVVNKEVLERIQEFFRVRGREMLESNNLQASLPESCTVIHNFHGTASGMWFEKNGNILVSMPGVPYEMKGIMEDGVFPKISERFKLSAMYHKTMHTQGLGESFLAERISDWENRVREDGLGLAYLPSPGTVKLRLTSSKGKIDCIKIDNYFKELELELPKHVFGYEKDTLSSVIGKLLLDKKQTISTVESCTSGSIAKEITKTPGASGYFEGSYITYSNEFKQQFLSVPSEILKKHGAVSEATVLLMAENGKNALGTDYCIATSGIAGPDGGTEEKPVGLIWVAIAHPNGVFAKKFLFGNNRENNIAITVLSALNLLRCTLLDLVE